MKKFAFIFTSLFFLAVGVKAASIAGPAGLFLQIGDSINELGDVDTDGASGGSCFILNGTTGKWEGAICPAGGGASTLQVSIGEIQVSSPTVSIDFSSHVFTATQSPSGESNIGLKGSSVTLMGNTFNVANLLVQLNSSALIPNALIDPSSITKLGGDIALTTETSGNYVASLVAGLGITVGSAGEGATPTVTFTPSLVTGNQTFGGNTTSNINWCFGIIGTDPCFTFSDDLITVTNLTVSGTLTATTGNITTLTAGGLTYPTTDGSAGQVMTTNGSGTMIFSSAGEGNSFGVSEGTVLISSPTSNIDFSSYTFNVSLTGSTTVQVTLNNSSVTLLGPSIDLGTDTTGDYVSSITVTYPLLGNTSGHVVISVDPSSVTLLGPSIDSDELPLHSGAHENGEIDEIEVTGLSGLLADPQTVIISTDGTVVHTSSGINFIPGSNITITGEANGGDTDITIAASSDGTGYALEPATVTIQADMGISASTITASTITMVDGGKIILGNSGGSYIKYDGNFVLVTFEGNSPFMIYEDVQGTDIGSLGPIFSLYADAYGGGFPSIRLDSSTAKIDLASDDFNVNAVLNANQGVIISSLTLVASGGGAEYEDDSWSNPIYEEFDNDLRLIAPESPNLFGRIRRIRNLKHSLGPGETIGAYDVSYSTTDTIYSYIGISTGTPQSGANVTGFKFVGYPGSPDSNEIWWIVNGAARVVAYDDRLGYSSGTYTQYTTGSGVGTKYINLKPPAAPTNTGTWTLPDPTGVSGYWKTDASGNLSVSSVSWDHITDVPDQHFSVTLSTWYASSNWAGDTFPIWQAPRDYAITITSITATAFSTSASSVTFNLEERAFNALNSAGTNVFTVAEATANVTGRLYGSSAFTNPGIAAGAYLVWDTDQAATGAVAKGVILTIYYRRDLE